MPIPGHRHVRAGRMTVCELTPDAAGMALLDNGRAAWVALTVASSCERGFASWGSVRLIQRRIGDGSVGVRPNDHGNLGARQSDGLGQR